MAISNGDRSAIAWTPIMAGGLVVMARIYVRLKIRAIGTDDYLMLMALAWALSYAILAQTLYSSKPITPLELSQYWTIVTMSSASAYLCGLFGKTSVGYLLFRVLGPTQKLYRWFIGAVLAGLYFLTFTVLLSIIFPLCSKEQLALKVTTGCLPSDTSHGFTQAWNFYGIFVDLAFGTLPVYFISKLNLSRNKKIALGLLMGLGWITATFILLRAISPYAQWSAERRSLIVNVATSMEQGLVMICGSLPALVPLYKYWTTGRQIRPHNAQESHTYVRETKQTLGAKNSMSTIDAGNSYTQQKSFDHPISGIRVDKQFDVSSAHRDTSLV